MSKKKSKNQVTLIIKALSSAESSISLAKQLLEDYSGVKVESASKRKEEIIFRDLPGISGTFDGQFLVGEGSGKKCQVPENYASKSKLVYGDTLKCVEVDGRQVFKQLERVERVEVKGILTKKGEDWLVATSDGSYQVLAAAVRFYEGQEGDEVVVLLPSDNIEAPFAAIESFAPKKEKKVIKIVKKEEKKAKPSNEDEGDDELR